MAKLKSQSQQYVKLKERDYLQLVENTMTIEALKIAGIEKMDNLESCAAYIAK